jgi:transcriptional regulator with XRE-family HTH domain
MPRPRLSDKQLLKALASRIEQARLAKGWSRERVAEVIETTPETIYRWESGRSGVTVPNLRRLARVLSVEFAWLLGVDPPGLRKGEAELLRLWRRLADDERRASLLLLRRLCS